MGFDLSFALRRAEPLSPAELDTLEQHLRTWREKIIGYDWHVPSGAPATDLIAWGSLRPTRGNPNVSDEGGYLADVIERLHDSLAEVRDLIRNANLAFSDDFGALEWLGTRFAYRKTAASADVPYDQAGWTSLATARNIPDGRAAAEAAKAARAAKPKTKAAAAAAVAELPRDELIKVVLAPLNRRVSDVERTAAVELLGADPDPAGAAALVARVRQDGFERPWTDAALDALAAGSRRCSWATALIMFDRGASNAAALLFATVTDDAIPHLARLPTSPRWSALAMQALDVLDSPAAAEAKRQLIERESDDSSARRLAIVTAVLAAQRTLRASSAWTGTGSAMPVLESDPAVHAALQQVASALKAFAGPTDDGSAWLAHDRNAGAKALAALDGKRVMQQSVNRGLAAMADFSVIGKDPCRLVEQHRVELWQLEADWLARNLSSAIPT